MIRGIHGMFLTDQVEEARAFFRDKLGLPFIDAGEGWLIFKVSEGDVGLHPLGEGQSPAHDISFYTDDVAATVAELSAKGVEFTGPVEDHGWGLATRMHIPGGLQATLYQPKYG